MHWTGNIKPIYWKKQNIKNVQRESTCIIRIQPKIIISRLKNQKILITK